MKRMLAPVLCCLTLALNGCLTHHVANNFAKYLDQQAGKSELGHIAFKGSYRLTEATRDFDYSFRAASAGSTNKWHLALGEMLTDYLESGDVQDALGGLKAGGGQAGNELLFDMTDYEFKNMMAYVEVKVTATRGGEKIFTHSYESKGKNQAGKILNTGMFGMNGAIQLSTKTAFDEIMAEIIEDLKSKN